MDLLNCLAGPASGSKRRGGRRARRDGLCKFGRQVPAARPSIFGGQPKHIKNETRQHVRPTEFRMLSSINTLFLSPIALDLWGKMLNAAAVSMPVRLAN